MARFKLYHYPATRSARVRWVLHETVGDFEIERLDLYRGAQYAPGYLALNPNHNVPLLEISFDDGRSLRMIESVAMVAYLADAYPEKKLAPPPTLNPERADYLQMMQFAGTHMDMALWQVRIHEHVLPPPERDSRTVARYRGKIEKEIAPQLKARLEKGGFICGAAFTAADCVVGHAVSWARAYGLCQDEVFQGYISRLAQRDAFRKAFDDVREFTPEPPQGRAGPSPFTG